jgi:hypothetical protein
MSLQLVFFLSFPRGAWEREFSWGLYSHAERIGEIYRRIQNLSNIGNARVNYKKSG